MAKFTRFNDWLREYRNAEVTERIALEAPGVDLAHKRRDELFDLIQADPREALRMALPFSARRDLPPAVAGLLEERVSGRGTLGVLALLPEFGSEGATPSVYRTAELGDRVFRAFVYGRRLDDPTRIKAIINGIAIDEFLAVNESPLRPLEWEEFAVLPVPVNDPMCGVSGLAVSATEPPLAADAGGEIIYLCDPAHLAAAEEQLVATEAGVSASEDGPSLAASPYTEGIKKLIVIRVDFSDLAGEPFSEERGGTMITNVHNFYRECSYERAGFAPVGEGSEVTPTFRLPQTAAWYGTNDASRLRRDARAAASAAGHTLDTFNFDLICFGRVPGFKFAGLGYVGASGAWLRDTSSTGVAAHELGHNFGLNHANFWDTSGQSIIGSGESVEYGDSFDTMGSATAGAKHFNARYKSHLNWLRSGETTNVTRSGTYRIVAHDDALASGIRGLRVTRSSGTNYWVEFRQKFTGNKWLMNGAGLRWAGNGNQSSLLLDTTPGSSNVKDDAALVIGRTFSDAARGLHITPVGKGGTVPESLEVVVNLGSFTNNSAPLLAVEANDTTGQSGDEFVLTARASDSDGDPLAYYWDLGAGEFGANEPVIRQRWNSSGDYLVRCVVSDMKGGVASGSVVLRVGAPNTFRISGRVVAGGLPLEGVRVSVSSTRVTYSDTDGRYALVGLPAGTYTLRASLEGYLFPAATVANPLTLGPSREGVDFIAAPPVSLETFALIPAGAVWQFLDDGSDQDTAWREASFDDTVWSEGPAPLGYGDDAERTPVGFGPNPNLKHLTTYFRRHFTVIDPRLFSEVTLGLRRDDGGAVYLNGREVFRSNLPSGTIRFDTVASSTVGSGNESAFFETSIDPTLLVAGTNVLAVEIHQVSRTSSDLVFDLRLEAIGAASPAPPRLGWVQDRKGIHVSWEDPTGLVTLFSAPSLSITSVWTAYELSISSSNGLRTVLIQPTNAQRYFRLGPR